MAAAALGHGEFERTLCWCCGGSFEDLQLTRLGDHPEVGVCAGCARWLHRRSRAAADSGSRHPAALARHMIDATRGAVMRRGIQDWPLIGPILRRLDHHLP